MPPVDTSLNLGSGSFEHLHSIQAFGKIPVHEFKSTCTGLTVVIAEVPGPAVHSFFTLATETFNDDGLPHALEYLIFFGSKHYPYTGVIELLENRCLASGKKSCVDITHMCYRMVTAGSEGFLSLLPIFMDHILYPILTEKSYTTKVHHISGNGEDAGYVYREMEMRERTAHFQIVLSGARAMYPGRCGYSSNVHGSIKNIRESTDILKVRKFHRKFFRPENLKIIVIGQVAPEEIFRALAPVEDIIISKRKRRPFTRPWQDPVPPLPDSQDLVIPYPSDTETDGMVCVEWRGCSLITDLYTTTALSLILIYLCDTPVSPLHKEFVDLEDPFARLVTYGVLENSETCFHVMFRFAPIEKLPLIKPKLDELLKQIVANDDIDMKRFKSAIARYKLELLRVLEKCPHQTVAPLIIQQMLYGKTKEDFDQILNPLVRLDMLIEEPKSYWVALLQKYFIDNKCISIQLCPSTEEQEKIDSEEMERINAQFASFRPVDLLFKQMNLMYSIAFNEKIMLPPQGLLTCVPIASVNSIKFLDVVRYSSTSKINKDIDLSLTPVFTYFDHLDITFVHMYALLDSATLSTEQRLYLPLLLETLLKSPVERAGELIPYEDVAAQLQDDTMLLGKQIGIHGCSHTALVFLQVEPSKYALGMNWLKELLYKTKFTTETLKIIATNLINDGSVSKNRKEKMAAKLMKGMCFVPDSNHQAHGNLKQQKFLTQLLEKLESSDSCSDILEELEKIRRIITNPSNVVLYLAANLDNLQPDAAKSINEFLPAEVNAIEKQQTLKITPDWKLLAQKCESTLSHCIVGMKCLGSVYFCRTTPSITSYNDPDYPALLVFAEYFALHAGPLWTYIKCTINSRNSCIITPKPNEGLLYLTFPLTTNVIGAYKETCKLITKRLKDATWNHKYLEIAKCTLIYQMVHNKFDNGDIVNYLLKTYFHGVEYDYNRILLSSIEKVSGDDLTRVGRKYVAELFNLDKVKTAIVCDPDNFEEMANEFKKMNIDVKVYPSPEESFLNL